MRGLRRSAAALGCAALLLPGCAAAPAESESVTVYAAASLQRVFAQIADDVEQAHPGLRVELVTDGSASLLAQIEEGAPADVFAAADEATMARAGELAPDPRIFATNTLVIAVPADNPAGVASLADLAKVTTVLCAPEVPCGAASADLLSAAGVAVQPASLEQNVAAVLAKVAAGEADAGLVYATDARGDDRVEAIVPAGAADVVNRYPIAVLRDAAHPDAAALFVDYVTSTAGAAVLTRYGFGAP